MRRRWIPKCCATSEDLSFVRDRCLPESASDYADKWMLPTAENRPTIEWGRTRDSGAPLLRTDSILMDMPAARANSLPLMRRRSCATDRRTRRLHCRMLRSPRDFASAR